MVLSGEKRMFLKKQGFGAKVVYFDTNGAFVAAKVLFGYNRG